MPARRQLLQALAMQDREVVNTEPVEMDGFDAVPTLQEQIKQFVRQEISKAAQDSGFGSFEEEDDFEDDDPPLWSSPYEMVEMVDEPIAGGETLHGTQPSVDNPTVDQATTPAARDAGTQPSTPVGAPSSSLPASHGPTP